MQKEKLLENGENVLKIGDNISKFFSLKIVFEYLYIILQI